MGRGRAAHIVEKGPSMVSATYLRGFDTYQDSQNHQDQNCEPPPDPTLVLPDVVLVDHPSGSKASS